MYLIMAHIVISVLGLDSTLQILLTRFDKKVGLKARPSDLSKGQNFVKQHSSGSYKCSGGITLVHQLTMKSSL